MDYFDDEAYEILQEALTDENEEFVEYDDKRCSCSFTGHRNLSDDEKRELVVKLHTTLQYLISIGVKEFHAGGAVGFDTVAAVVVCQLKKLDADVKLILDIPYENQMNSKWTEQQKRHYMYVYENADEVYCHSKKTTDYNSSKEALLKRNRIMVDSSYYCVCYLRNNENKGGTAYTVNYAKKRGAHIINLAKE